MERYCAPVRLTFASRRKGKDISTWRRKAKPDTGVARAEAPMSGESAMPTGDHHNSVPRLLELWALQSRLANGEVARCCLRFR